MELSSIYSKLAQGKVCDLPDFKNIDTSTYEFAKQIMQLRMSGKIEEANALKEENAEILEGTEFTAEMAFQLFEELTNIETLVVANHQNCYVVLEHDCTEVPKSIKIGDVFISDIKDITTIE